MRNNWEEIKKKKENIGQTKVKKRRMKNWERIDKEYEIQGQTNVRKRNGKNRRKNKKI